MIYEKLRYYFVLLGANICERMLPDAQKAGKNENGNDHIVFQKLFYVLSVISPTDEITDLFRYC